MSEQNGVRVHAGVSKRSHASGGAAPRARNGQFGCQELSEGDGGSREPVRRLEACSLQGLPNSQQPPPPPPCPAPERRAPGGSPLPGRFTAPRSPLGSCKRTRAHGSAAPAAVTPSRRSGAAAPRDSACAGLPRRPCHLTHAPARLSPPAPLLRRPPARRPQAQARPG